MVPKLKAACDGGTSMFDLVLGVGKELGELEHRLARHDDFLARQIGCELEAAKARRCPSVATSLSCFSSTTISRPLR